MASSEIKATELIHLSYDGNFQLENKAVVLCSVIDDKATTNSTKMKNIPIQLQLDITSMHPQGGGQPTDTGTITAISSSDDGTSSSYSAKINKVTIDRSTGIVTHTGNIWSDDPNNTNTSIESDFFPTNTKVKVSVDADNRQILSECHTAGHVVDAAMSRIEMNLKPTKGYHFLDGPYVEYKGTIDVKERDDLLSRLKVAYQELIDEDIQTNIQTLQVDEADSLCNRVALNFNLKDFTSPNDPDPKVRVVTVAGYNCPCGGTHVKSTGVLKNRGWCVKGLRCKKGVVRIRYGMKED